MATSTEEHAIQDSPNEPLMGTCPIVQTPKSISEHFLEYGRERPGVVALWCFGVGFVLGWKLKLW